MLRGTPVTGGSRDAKPSSQSSPSSLLLGQIKVNLARSLMEAHIYSCPCITLPSFFQQTFIELLYECALLFKCVHLFGTPWTV